MSIDPAAIRSRRAVLGATLGAVAAVAAQAIGRPLPAAAGGQALTLGITNTSDASTTVNRSDDKTNVTFTGPAVAIAAHTFASGGRGIISFAQGTAATALEGNTEGHSDQVAIHADTTFGLGEGIGLHAETQNGIAILAACTGGAALVANGLTEFSRSGRTSFTTGQSKRTFSGFRLTADSLVLATIQGAVPGVSVLGVVVNVPKQQFTIKLNRPAPRSLTVGWFIVN